MRKAKIAVGIIALGVVSIGSWTFECRAAESPEVVFP